MMKWIVLIGLAIASPEGLCEDLWRTTTANRAWQKECGNCHMPFPPALLSAENWHRLMEGLEHHFGDDANLDAKTVKEIGAFLEDNAAMTDVDGHSSEALRITDTPWFTRKHRGAIRLLKKGRIKTLTDCLACHKGREAG